MPVSVFNLFSIGIGPSSSHTVGPMRAARLFVLLLAKMNGVPQANRLIVDLYGSLALTGKGHSTDLALLLGLEGWTPEGVDPGQVQPIIQKIRQDQALVIPPGHTVPFNEKSDMLFHCDKQLPYHPNGMRFTAYDAQNKVILQKIYYSVGGGFIVEHDDAMQDKGIIQDSHQIPFPFKTAEELLAHCRSNHFSIAQLMMENEKAWRPEQEIKEGLLRIWGSDGGLCQ